MYIILLYLYIYIEIYICIFIINYIYTVYICSMTTNSQYLLLNTSCHKIKAIKSSALM